MSEDYEGIQKIYRSLGVTKMSEGEWHKKVRENLKGFLENKRYDVKSSHTKQGGIPLYARKGSNWRKSNASRLSDVDIIVLKKGKPKYLIEIENSTQPKHIFGVISATNSANYCEIGNPSRELSGVHLFVVVRNEVVNKKSEKRARRSEKPKQLKLIKEELEAKLRKGSILKFDICTETEFQERFEKAEG